MSQTTVRIDAGPIVALLSDRDTHHHACVAQAQKLLRAPYTCWPAVTEAAYLLRHTPDAVDALLTWIERGKLLLLTLTEDDTAAIRAILSTYKDQGFDFADACLMHLADREGIEQVFTLDRRHFGVFRSKGGRTLSLLPAAG